jgi:hypothetical protein
MGTYVEPTALYIFRESKRYFVFTVFFLGGGGYRRMLVWSPGSGCVFLLSQSVVQIDALEHMHMSRYTHTYAKPNQADLSRCAASALLIVACSN